MVPCHHFPLPRCRTHNSITMAEDVSDYTNKCYPRHSWPADHCLYTTAHSVDYCGDCWWQIFIPAHKLTPDFEGEKLPQIFRLICRNIRYVCAGFVCRNSQGNMASYYDEHDCRLLADGEHPNHLLHLARCVAISMQYRIFSSTHC